MQFPKSFTLNKKFLLVSILPILFSVSTYAMEGDYHLFDVEEGKKCCWKKVPADDGLEIFEETNQKCNLLKSLFCCCKQRERDIEEGLEEEETTKYLSKEKLKSYGKEGMEMAFWTAAEVAAHTFIGDGEGPTFFFQHAAGRSYARNIKFENKALPKYLALAVIIYFAGIGIKYFDNHITGFSTGINVALLMAIITLFENYWNGINRPVKED